MERFGFSISGKPCQIGKVYNKFKDLFSDWNSISCPYQETVSLPRGYYDEIEVLSKKGYHVIHFSGDSQIYSHLSTKFFRDKGMTLGINSKLNFVIKSDDFSKLTKILSKISEVDPVFEEKENNSFLEERNPEFLDFI
ncbi:MAG: hypothetical protein Q8Q04_03040 [archaeon]|nr:hypothetical protein [archaeon]